MKISSGILSCIVLSFLGSALLFSPSIQAQEGSPLRLKMAKELPQSVVIRYNHTSGEVALLSSSQDLQQGEGTETLLKAQMQEFKSLGQKESLVGRSAKASHGENWFLYFYGNNPNYPSFFYGGFLYRLEMYHVFHWYNYEFRLFKMTRN